MSKRTYSQFCGLAKALDVVGERWTLLVVRNLLLGPMRYSDLQKSLPGITSNLLAKRLKEMEEHNLLERRRYPASSSPIAYQLTPAGRELEPVIHALGAWGGRYMDAPQKSDHVNFEWMLIAFKRRYRGGISLVVELSLGDAQYELQFNPDRVDIQRGAALHADLQIGGNLAALRKLLYGKHPLDRMSSGLAIKGDREALEKLLQTI